MIFQLIEKNMSILGISKTQSARLFRTKVSIGCIFLGVSIVLHFKFLYSEANGFEEITQSIFISSVTVITFWCFISLILKSDELFEFMDESKNLFVLFRETLNEEYPSALTALIRAEQLVVKCSEVIYLVVTLVTPVSFILPKYFYCMYCYYVKDLGSDSFELMNNVEWFPFDWKNPMGYSIATAFQLTMMTYSLFVVANLVAFGIGCFLIGIASSKEINNILKIANKKLRLKKERSTAMKRFTDLIEWHVLVKQLINSFSSLFQPIFLAAFIWSVISICAALLLIQMEMTVNEFNSMVLVVLVVDVSYAFGMIYIVCELCQQTCDGYEEMNDTIGQYDWPSYPIEIQRILPIVISFAQQSAEVKVFGSIACCRETFKNITNNAFSYFMTIRNFF